MADSFVQVLIHITFHVKADGVLIDRNDLPRVFQYIGGVISTLKGIPLAVGGMPDHIHILTTLPATISLANFMMNIKKGSSKWIKGINPQYSKFAWQNGYGGFSVSYSIRNNVIGYIMNQEHHHSRQTYREEFKSFLEANEIEFDEQYL